MSGRSLRRRNQPGVANRISCGIKNVPVVEGGREIRMIQYVKKFRSKLDVETIGDALNSIVFEDRGIEIDQAGPYQRVTPQVSAKGDRIGHAEALRLNIVVGVARIYGRGTTRTGK